MPCTLSNGQTIRTTYTVASSRVTARSNGGASLHLGRDFSKTHEEMHRLAAEALAKRLGWEVAMIGGLFGNSMYWVQSPEG